MNKKPENIGELIEKIMKDYNDKIEAKDRKISELELKISELKKEPKKQY